MTPLAQKIAAHLAVEGAMGLDRFWNFALFDREHGYYSSREPFGRGGDFVTAPEVSQMFGELVGAWIAAAWKGLGAPERFVLAEIGPGRGTLMADILRTIRGVAPDCLRAAQVRLVEVSDRLAMEQEATLSRFDLPIRRVRRIEELEAGPLIVVANELFDALPIRQFVFDGEDWRERCVALAHSERFEYVLCARPPQSAELDAVKLLPAPMAGAVLETSPARARLAEALAGRLAAEGGAGLFFDYGHAATGYGDTLQALHQHAYADPLDRPGESDLTSHVDFAALATIFAKPGLVVAPTTSQGEFLLSLGLLERAGRLGAEGGEVARQAVQAAVERLAGSGTGQMGQLFKVLAVASQPLELAPFR